MIEVAGKERSIVNVLIGLGYFEIFNPQFTNDINSMKEELKSIINEVQSNTETIIDSALQKLIKSVEVAKENLSSKSMVFDHEEIEISEKFENILNKFDEIVFAYEALNIYSKDYSVLEKAYKTISDEYDKLILWFYSEYEPYRLVLFNNIRKTYHDNLDESFRPDFPWYDIYIDENPYVFFDLVHAEIKGFIIPEHALAKAAIESDELLRDYFEHEYEFYSNFYLAMESNKVLRLFLALREEAMNRPVPNLVEMVGPEKVGNNLFKERQADDELLANIQYICCTPPYDKDKLNKLRDLEQKMSSMNAMDGLFIEYFETGRGEEKLAEKLFDDWIAGSQRIASEIESSIKTLVTVQLYSIFRQIHTQNRHTPLQLYLGANSLSSFPSCYEINIQKTDSLTLLPDENNLRRTDLVVDEESMRGDVYRELKNLLASFNDGMAAYAIFDSKSTIVKESNGMQMFQLPFNITNLEYSAGDILYFVLSQNQNAINKFKEKIEEQSENAADIENIFVIKINII